MISIECKSPSLLQTRGSEISALQARTCRASMLAKCEVNRLAPGGLSKWNSVCAFGRPAFLDDHKVVRNVPKAIVSLVEEAQVATELSGSHQSSYQELISQLMASSAISLANAALAAVEEAAALAAEEHSLDKLLLEEQVLLRGIPGDDGAVLHAEPSGRTVEPVVKSGRRMKRLKTKERVEKAVELELESSKIDPEKTRLHSRKRGLLSADEELALIKGVQEFAIIERARSECMDKLQREPTLKEWANATGIEARCFNKRLHRGRMCKDKMIRHNTGLVTMVAKTYLHHGLPLEDLMQDGWEGLIRGVEKFDPSKGFRLSTYVYWWIKQAIGKAVARKARPVRLPVHYFEFLSKVKRTKRDLVEQLGRHPSDREVAEAAGVKISKLQSMMLWSRKVKSFDVPVGPEKDMSLHELTPDEADQNEMRLLMLKDDVDKTLKQMLTPREEQVVRERFGMNGTRAKTLEEIGVIYNLTRERIRQIEIRAMGKLKNSDLNRHLRLHLDLDL